MNMRIGLLICLAPLLWTPFSFEHRANQHVDWGEPECNERGMIPWRKQAPFPCSPLC